jgi:ferric-dicitrate binding protein FerR (iron transport regulator)
MRFDGEILKQRMADAGFPTQVSLATAAGVHQGQVSLATYGKSIPDHAGEKIKAALDVGYPPPNEQADRWARGQAVAEKMPLMDNVVEYFLEIEERVILLLDGGMEDTEKADELLQMLPETHARRLLDWYFHDEAPTPVTQQIEH